MLLFRLSSIFTILLISIFLVGCKGWLSVENDNNITSNIQQELNNTRLSIPMREHGYSNFETIIIDSGTSLTKFLSDVESQEHWNNKTEFTTVFDNTTINFETKNLIFYRITEGSGSIKLTPQTPTIKDSNFIVSVKREVPEIGTADMSYNCLAYLIDKNITEITFNVGKNTEKLTSYTSANCSLEYTPVCAAKTVQCITAPCNPIAQTYPNVCMLNADETATYLFDGECPRSEVPDNCTLWYDGCNNCYKDERNVSVCTEVFCELPKRPFNCKDYL